MIKTFFKSLSTIIFPSWDIESYEFGIPMREKYSLVAVYKSVHAILVHIHRFTFTNF